MPRSRILNIGLVLALVALAPACSKKAERLVGNEILARGPDGFGTTAREVSPIDRDTYLATGTTDRGTTLLAGASGTFEAQALIKIGTWVLPDTNDVTVVVDSIRLELPFDGKMSIPDIDLELRLAASPWDTTTVAWPGPGLGTALASANAVDAIGDFALEIGGGSFDLVQSWATNPASLNGFVVRIASGVGVAAFRAGTGRIRIVYHSATSTRSTADTPFQADLFIHSPLTPAPTGADTTLILGGLYAPVVAFHAPIDSFTPGFSINEARIVFRVRGDSPTFPDSIVVNVEAR
ncbi:MAG TPA: hypothetical protein VJW75_01910, partial [Candidatus Eisenbacteria bacterium]|nr:hypothetical protein [Candidatus Eisenbacteria bacterium]